jgi:hypothetical protein
MTDDQILDFVKEVDSFLIKNNEDLQISMIDMSAIINSRLRVMNAESGTEEDFNDLMSHLISQTVKVPKTIH